MSSQQPFLEGEGEESEETFASAHGEHRIYVPEYELSQFPLNQLGSTAPDQREDEESEETRSYVEVEHDLFNSVIDKDQEKIQKVKAANPDTNPRPQSNSNERNNREPNPGPSGTVPVHREHHLDSASPATPSRDSADSADTVRGAGVKRSPKRKTIVDEDEPMDDGELADSESDVNMEEPLDKQIVSSFAKSK